MVFKMEYRARCDCTNRLVQGQQIDLKLRENGNVSGLEKVETNKNSD